MAAHTELPGSKVPDVRSGVLLEAAAAVCQVPGDRATSAAIGACEAYTGKSIFTSKMKAIYLSTERAAYQWPLHDSDQGIIVTASVTCQLCADTAQLHKHNFIHRHKPSNDVSIPFQYSSTLSTCQVPYAEKIVSRYFFFT